MKKKTPQRFVVPSLNPAYTRFMHDDGTEHYVLNVKDRCDAVTEWVQRDTGHKFLYVSPLKLSWTPWRSIVGLVAEMYTTEIELHNTRLNAEIVMRDGQRYCCEVSSSYLNDSLGVVAHQAFGTWDEAITWCDVIATVSNPYELACSLEMGGHK